MRYGYLILAVLMFTAAPAAAEWSHDVLHPDKLEFGLPGTKSEMCVTGAEGNILVVYTKESALGLNDSSVLAQSLGPDGTLQWGDGIVVHAAAGSACSELTVCSDGQGGAFAVFTYQVGGNWIGMAQHVLYDGSLGWEESVVLSPSYASTASSLVATMAENGDLLVAWSDNRNFATNSLDIYAQRVTRYGNIVWGNTGLLACNAEWSQDNAQICFDNEGGAFIAWTDGRNYMTTGYDIYANHVDAGGNANWTSTGWAIDRAAEVQSAVKVVPGIPGRCIMTWYSNESGVGDIKIASIRSDQYSSWSAFLTDSSTGTQHPAVTPDGNYGAYIAWPQAGDGNDIYVQWVDAGGIARWADGGVAAGLGEYYQSAPVLAAHPDGGVAVAWDHGASSIATQYLDAAGVRQWGYGGRVISSSWAAPHGIDVCMDARGGLIADWHDDREGDTHSYVMRVDFWGYPGDPSPVIADVFDCPYDQGGVAIVDWQRSYLDAQSELAIGHYSVWRRYAGTWLPEKSRTDPDVQLAAAMESGLPIDRAAAMIADGWVYESSVEAGLLPEYSAHVPTYGIATDSETPVTEFKVLAHGIYTYPIWESGVMSGWSTDNLPPSAPRELDATWTAGGAYTEWLPPLDNTEDLQMYRVYRSLTRGFTIGPDSFVGNTSDTFFTEAGVPFGNWFLKVTALDIHGNEGPPSNETTMSSTSGVEDGSPVRAALCGAWPNPFNPSTRIAFDLPDAAYARLVILDARGRVVRDLAEGMLAAGRNIETWDGRSDEGRAMPSGVYFARLESAAYRGTIKLMLAR